MVTIDSKEKGKIVLQQAQNSVETAQWEITEPEKSEVNAPEVAKLIKNILELKTYDWESNPAMTDNAMGLLEPQLTITLITKSGKQEVVTIGEKLESSSKLYLKTTSTKVPFIIWSSDAGKLNKGFDDLKKVEEKTDSTAVTSEK